MKNRTEVERRSERELVVTRTVNAPARLVFEAWTKAELFRRWWVPKRLGRTCFPAKWMFALEDSIVWCFATKIRRWSSSARTSK